MSGWNWKALALAIDHVNAGISQDIRVGGIKVVFLPRDAAQLVRDAAEAWQRDYGRPVLNATIDGVLAWLDEAPADWPFTGADIAQFIRNGCPDWTETDSLRRLQEAAQGDVADWIEEQDWDTVPASFVAACVREQFGLADPSVPPTMGIDDWRAQGFEPGDVINRDGDLLLGDGSICQRGAVNCTLRQSALAAPFGWIRTGGQLNSGPLGVVMVERR